MEVIEYSKNIKDEATAFIEEIGILKILNNYGNIRFTGSYASDIMINRDIDIYITKNSDYSIEEFVEIFKTIFISKITPGIHCGNETDFKNPRYNFPKGYYMGIKSNFRSKKWKIDIWFINEKEMENISYIDLKKDINENNKLLLLEIKYYTMMNNVKIPSVQIYDYIFKQGVNSLEQFIKLIG